MLRCLFLIIFLIFVLNSRSQNNEISDTTYSNITVVYKKVHPSFKTEGFVNSNKALMDIFHITNKQLFLIKFEVPSFLYRASTTLNDYVVIKVANKEYKYYNQI